MTTLQKLRKIVEKEFGEKCPDYGDSITVTIKNGEPYCATCEAHKALEKLEILLDYYKD
jgi:hypothetical protein